MRAHIFPFGFPSGRRTAYNWLTGSSVDTLADYTVGTESMSALMVFDKKTERRMASRRPVGEGFGMRRLTSSSDEVDSRTAGQLGGTSLKINQTISIEVWCFIWPFCYLIGLNEK